MNPLDSSDFDRFTLAIDGTPDEPEWQFEPTPIECDNPITAIEQDLRPCPFPYCKGQAELVLIMNDLWKVQCLKCGASTRASTRYEHVARLWNAGR